MEKKYKDKGVKILSNLLKKEKIHNFQIEGRLKSFHRIYQKMQKKYQSKDISNVLDLLAYRIITESEADCYLVLGIIHKYYTPLIKKIKDYIAMPKVNNYRSIHTTVL
ncbi:MAG: bifunctional (p)ppGpp synthetase/guanosine-3',5'-bis(diphosphate) 3'-pyrophosphohydrolase [bacterium]|nr:bifunctional (p)ppGpp synthetase/guanosine-3',5'-bis(diphosphate) 3'-pyrophosphohydrolase [bacterium]